jgi:MraZ protein
MNSENLFPGLFVGEYDHVLDAQGRVSLPSDWRSKDQETELMMIPTRDKALLLLPMATFYEFTGKVGKMAIANPGAQRALAYLGSSSRRCRCDKQGRMALDRAKLDSIGVGKKLKLIGAVTHIRICAPENWVLPENPDEYLNEIQQMSDGNDGLDALGGLLQGVLTR